MANAPTKPTTPVKKESSSASGAFATLTIPICIVVAILIFVFILGDPSHYKGGDPENEPVPGDLFRYCTQRWGYCTYHYVIPVNGYRVLY
jgi:biopolymer transport protein ExbB